MAEDRADSYREPEPSDAPSFWEFDAHRYDFARIIALLEMLLVAAQRGNPADAGIEPYVPIPAVSRVRRDKGVSRLLSTVSRALGKEV